MIDLHTHVIFGVDDGPKTLAESMALIEESYRQGVQVIVATSHRRKGMFETKETLIKHNFETLKAAISTRFPNMTLLYGAEIFCTFDVFKKIDTGEFPCLANSQYVLLEFSQHTSFGEMYKAVDKLRGLGKIPLIAHIERYNVLENQEKKVAQLIAKGAYIQINAGSVLKPKLLGDPQKVFKKRAKYFMTKNLVHVIASDMHNLNTRQPYMKIAYQQVVRQYGRERANRLFKHNPNRIVNDNII